MAFVLSEEEEAIRKTARGVVRERAPVGRVRELRDSRDATGFARELWSELCGLGLAGLPIAAEHGGAGLGLRELGLVLEECGRQLAATPLLSTIVLGAGLIQAAGSAEQQASWLPGISSGERLVALAHDEGGRHARSPARAGIRVEGPGEAWLVVTGEKTMVLDGHVADGFVVSGRAEGPGGEMLPGGSASGAAAGADPTAVSLVLVPAGTDGVVVTRLSLVDGRNAARVEFHGARVPRAALLGAHGGGGPALSLALDRGAAALSAEMLGGALEIFERTVAYLKERRQFGVAIGSFQALKHRAAAMFCELELSKSVVREALCAADEGRADAALLASAAKARLTETFLLTANEAVQMHGGVGVTDELDVGFFLKRARVAEMTLGDAAYHRDRFARLSGY
jgi:alkylation response protein AidB-like acyl-CoA dehydrogenase